MKKIKLKKEETTSFHKGDWISTTEIKTVPGQKYTNAYVIKVTHKGKFLNVRYGSWMNVATVEAKSCKLLKRG